MTKQIPLAILLFAAGCATSRYTIVRDFNFSGATTTMPSNRVFVGWLPVDPNGYVQRGYASAAEYASVIGDMHRELQEGLSELEDGLSSDHPKRKYLFAKSPTDSPPAGVELIVAFKGTEVTEKTGTGHSGITIATTVEFFDAKTGRDLRSTDIEVTTYGLTFRSNGWSEYNLERCLGQAAYNLGVFVGTSLSPALARKCPGGRCQPSL